ncbi:MAG TPA: YlbF family regulator [Spirochaetota bacterium]|nr:YlbF family regulator [Spirochaetota bacterium]HPV42855.1 YlbF family regulator [Spirochaetota bacterium]
MSEDLHAILQQAEELGRLIRSTSIYRDYMAAKESLNADGDAAKLLEEYTNLCRSIKERQDMSDIIEKYEFENLESMTGLVSGNEAIMGFLEAQKDYLDLLTRIQDELADTGLPGE